MSYGPMALIKVGDIVHGVARFHSAIRIMSWCNYADEVWFGPAFGLDYGTRGYPTCLRCIVDSRTWRTLWNVQWYEMAKEEDDGL